MSKIDEYKTIKAENEEAIEKLNWCMGKVVKTYLDNFCPQEPRIEFSARPTCFSSEYVIQPIIRHDYIDSPKAFSATNYKAVSSIADAINIHIHEIIPTAQRLLQTEIDKARCQAMDEAKEIIGDLGCSGNCECVKSPILKIFKRSTKTS